MNCKCTRPTMVDFQVQCDIPVPDVNIDELKGDDIKTRFYTGIIY